MTDKEELQKLKKDLDHLESEISKKEEEIQEKNKEISDKNQKMEEYHDQLQRLQADFENFKKRSEKNMKDYVKYANENLIIKIIDAYEDFERALEADPKDLKEGVEIIYKKLKDILEGEGLCQIKAQGEKFDPFKHEALMVEDNKDYDDDIVIEELGKGYTLGSKVIKYSKVKVCKRK